MYTKNERNYGDIDETREKNKKQQKNYIKKMNQPKRIYNKHMSSIVKYLFLL